MLQNGCTSTLNAKPDAFGLKIVPAVVRSPRINSKVQFQVFRVYSEIQSVLLMLQCEKKPHSSLSTKIFNYHQRKGLKSSEGYRCICTII